MTIASFQLTRRRLLHLTAAGSMAGLAGCVGDQSAPATDEDAESRIVAVGPDGDCVFLLEPESATYRSRNDCEIRLGVRHARHFRGQPTRTSELTGTPVNREHRLHIRAHVRGRRDLPLLV